MATQKVNIKVSAQGVGLAKSEIKGLEGSIQKMGKAVAIATGAYFGARGLISGLSTVVNLSAEQELAEKKLSTALGKTSKSLLEQASALQKVTTFGDEAIISQQAFLASLGFTEDKIKEIIPVALDLSSATGMALDSAVRNLAKTFSGLQGELGETVLELKTLTQEELKAGDALKVISDLMGGSAQENTETLAGKLGQTTNAVLDAGESIGELLAPTVIHTANAVAFLSGKIVKFGKFIGDFIAGGDTATETTNEFAQAQTSLATETTKANSALEKQKTIQQLLTEFSNKTVSGYEDEIVQLKIREAELNGSTEAQIEYMKAGFFDEKIPDAIKKQIDALIAQREIVKGLEENQNAKNKAQEMDFKTFADNQLTKLQLLEAEEQNTKKFIEDYPKMAKALGMINQTKEEAIELDVKNAFMSQKTASQTAKAIIRSETMEAVSGAVSSIFKNFPFPFSVILASGAGALVSGALNSAFSGISTMTAETGFEGVVSKPTLFLTGENNKPEQVSVTPLGGESASGITVNISAPLVDETVVESIIPAIERAKKMNLA